LSEQLQLRNGTSTQIASFTGASAECVVDTTNNRLVVSDGSTAGGWPSSKLSETLTNTYAAVSDTAYSLTAPAANSNWVTTIGYTALTAARIVSLPAASSYPTGTRLTIADEIGLCTSVLTIAVSPNGTDDINGANSSVVLNTAYAHIALISDGVSKWTIVDQGYLTATKSLAESAHGALVGVNVLEATATSLSGTSVNVSTQIPANCILLAVGVRVTTTITIGGAGVTGTGFEVGMSGSGSSQFGSSLSLSSGSTNDGLIGPVGIYALTTITLTPQGTGGTPTFTGGAVRLAIHYLSVNPPAQ
jgi:hypothetical protein